MCEGGRYHRRICGQDEVVCSVSISIMSSRRQRHNKEKKKKEEERRREGRGCHRRIVSSLVTSRILRTSRRPEEQMFPVGTNKQ